MAKTQKYRLLAGQYEYTPPGATRDPVSNIMPSKVVGIGGVVESEIDLVARFGSEKFQLVGRPVMEAEGPPGTPSLESMVSPSTECPNGQVMQGYQQATSIAPGVTASGALRGETGVVAGDGSRVPVGDAREDRGDRPDFSNMTVEQLKDYAVEKDIDLEGATRKAEIIEILER